MSSNTAGPSRPRTAHEVERAADIDGCGHHDEECSARLGARKREGGRGGY